MAQDPYASLRRNAPFGTTPPEPLFTERDVASSRSRYEQMPVPNAANEGWAQARASLAEQYEPIYADIERRRKEEDERLKEPIAAAEREITRKRLEPASDKILSDLGVAGDLTGGEAIEEELRRGTEERKRAHDEAMLEREYGGRERVAQVGAYRGAEQARYQEEYDRLQDERAYAFDVLQKALKDGRIDQQKYDDALKEVNENYYADMDALNKRGVSGPYLRR